MQTKKTDIRQTVLETARREFLKRGFKNTSMRQISGNSGVGLSNIYNYFRNKDELLESVLQPFLLAFEDIMDKHNSESNTTIDIFTSTEYQRKTIESFVTLIKRFRKELKLLMLASHGSTFENYREHLIKQNTQTGLQYMQTMNQRYPELHTNISAFFIHTTSSWWISILEEIASHDELSDTEIEQFVSEYICFGTAGWKALMKV